MISSDRNIPMLSKIHKKAKVNVLTDEKIAIEKKNDVLLSQKNNER